MRDVDSSFLSALVRAREEGIVPRKLITITGKTYASSPASISRSFWTGDEDVNITVKSGFTGQEVTRAFYGGVLNSISSIPRVSNMTIQTVTANFSLMAPIVEDFVRGYNLRLASVEIYEGLLDPKSPLFVSIPPLVFLGEVDGGPIEIGEAGSEASVDIKIVSDAINMLTRKNPQKSSYEAQKRRSNDQFGKYSNVVKNWDIPWGVKRR